MARLTKKQVAYRKAFDLKHFYPLVEGIELVQKMAKTKFDSSVDIAVNLGIDPKKPAQKIHGSLSLPHGTGKVPVVLVICTADKEQEAKDAGADHVGSEAYLEKIEKGWTEFDVLITMPSLMSKLAKFGKLLGPKGLMPNLKKGTITQDVGKAVQAIKGGQISIEVDKAGILHTSVGRVSFSKEQLKENIQELITALRAMKPSSVKTENYIQHITLSSTMGPSVSLIIPSNK